MCAVHDHKKNCLYFLVFLFFLVIIVRSIISGASESPIVTCHENVRPVRVFPTNTRLTRVA